MWRGIAGFHEMETGDFDFTIMSHTHRRTGGTPILIYGSAILADEWHTLYILRFSSVERSYRVRILQNSMMQWNTR